MSLVDDARNGDRRALGRLVSDVEDDTTMGRETLAAVYQDGGAAWITGITGAPGAGKSTLVDLLIEHARLSGPVAVVAIDPSSAFTGGAGATSGASRRRRRGSSPCSMVSDIPRSSSRRSGWVRRR